MTKKIFYILILSAIIMSTACENEPYDGKVSVDISDEDSIIPEDFENTFFARLNGLEFNDQHIYTIVSTGTDDSDFIAITCSENNYHSIILYIPSDIVIGTYYYSPETLEATPNLNITYSNLAELLQSGVGDGYIIIDEHNLSNHYIKGRFECVVNSQNGSINTITEGSFEVVYAP